MNAMRRASFAVLVFAAALLAGEPAAAWPASESPMLAQADGPSLSQAVEQVRRQYRGRIVSAETQVRGNREVHVIKVLTDDGKVKTVQVPGRVRNGRG